MLKIECEKLNISIFCKKDIIGKKDTKRRNIL